MRLNLLVLLCLLSAGTLVAGTVQIRDEEGVLSEADKQTLDRAGQSVPFDTFFVTTHVRDLDTFVVQQISEPNQVAIGLDTVHRKVRIKIGRGLIAGPGVLDASARRGNGAMKQGRWGDGLAVILQAVGEAVTPPPIAVAAERVATVAQTQSPSGLPWWLVLLGAAGIGGIVWLVLRRSRAERKEAAAEVRRPAPSQNFTRPVPGYGTQPIAGNYSAPYSAPSVVVVPGSSGPSLVDYAIADSIIHRHDASAPAPTPTPAPSYRAPEPSPAPSPSYDSGGSSWGSSDSSSGGGGFDGGSSGGSDF